MFVVAAFVCLLLDPCHHKVMAVCVLDALIKGRAKPFLTLV